MKHDTEQSRTNQIMVREMNFKIMRFEFQSMTLLLVIISFGIIGNSNAETLTFSSFRIEVQDDWVHNLEEGPNVHNEMGEQIIIHHPDGSGVLKMQTYNAPNLVSKEILRNMTNVDASIPLTWQDWGDYSGYQYEYSERGSFNRQWWLVNQRTIIFIVYESSVEPKDIEVYEIDRIVNSMTVIEP